MHVTTTSTEDPDSREVQTGDDEFKILQADEEAEEKAAQAKSSDDVEIPIEPEGEILDNRVPIIGKFPI